MFHFIKQHPVLSCWSLFLAFVVGTFILFLILFFCVFPDIVHETAPDSYSNRYHFFDVPLTQKLVENLETCSPYRSKYKRSLLSNLWNHSSITGQKILLFEPRPDDMCGIIQKEGSVLSPFSVTVREMVIPPELARKSAEMLSEFLKETPDNDKLGSYEACIFSCTWDTHEFYGTLFIELLEEYLRNFDVNDREVVLPSAENIRQEKEICVSVQQKLEELVRRDDFSRPANSGSAKHLGMSEQSLAEFYQGKQMSRLLPKGNSLYMLPGKTGEKWTMGFLQAHSACAVSADDDGQGQYMFYPFIKKDPIVCQCW